MGSIRTRLTAAYAAAFIGTLLVYSVALLIVRREYLLQDVERMVQREADQVVRAVNLARNVGTEPVVAQEDPLAGPRVSLRMRAFLSMLDGYVLVQDSTGYDIYASPNVQLLSATDRDEFSSRARLSKANGPAERVNLRADRILLATRRIVLG